MGPPTAAPRTLLPFKYMSMALSHLRKERIERCAGAGKIKKKILGERGRYLR
jgi:hypothetical protein